MGKKEKNVKNKPYDSGTLLKEFIVLEIILLYLTLQIGDIVHMAGDAGDLFTRYIPVAIVAFASTFFAIKSKAKKCNKSQESGVRKNIILGPILVAIILLFYGLYSVSVKVKEAEASLGIYKLLYSESEIEVMIDELAGEARLNWFITSIIYLAAAETMAFLSSKKLDKWLKDEPLIETILEEQPKDEENMELLNSGENSSPQEETAIKWDL